jgi:hypothetical protein
MYFFNPDNITVSLSERHYFNGSSERCNGCGNSRERHESRTEEKTLVTSCQYADIRAGETPRVPYTLLGFECGSSLKDILAFVNEELEGGFTHILITEEHNIKLKRPICGAI